MALPLVAGTSAAWAQDLSGVQVDPTATPLPSADAVSFLVADLDTGDILAAKNAHEQHPPASTLKMLTALAVLPRLNLDAVHTASYADTAVDGSKVGIVEGSTYTAKQLLEGMFLVSGNDAATAVADLNGGVNSTVDQMQDEAERLGARDTTVGNPSGLDAPGQVSSAYDLALFARAGMQRSDFAAFVATAHSTFPVEGTEDPTKRNTFEIWNQNTLVTGGYDGGIGLKSGYTTNAGRTLAAAAERDGHRYLVTLMGIAGKTYDTGALYLDWAFANSEAKPIGRLGTPVRGSASSDGAVLMPAIQSTALQAADSASEPGPIQAPASSGPSRFPFVVAFVALGSCFIIWWRLRAQHRKAIRRRASTSATVRLLEPDEVTV